MTRQEAEEKITQHLLEIRKIHHEYNPDGVYLTIAMMEESMFFFNDIFKADKEKPLDKYVRFDDEATEEQRDEKNQG